MEPDAVAGIVAQWAHERPDLDAGPMLVLGRIARLNQLVDGELRPPLAHAQLADGDFDVLAALRRRGAPYGCRPVELSRSLMVTTGGISKRIDRLQRRGLVQRDGVSHDARGTQVQLTPDGYHLVERLIEVHLENERRLLSGLSEEERQQLGHLLGRLTADLEHPQDAPTGGDTG